MTQAMRRFAAWATGREHRLILLAVVFVQLLAPVAGALIVLAALRLGPKVALRSGLIASAGFAALAIVVGAGTVEAVGLTVPLLLGIASGAVLGWSRSLSLAFQVTVVGVIVGSLAAFVLVIDPASVGAFVLNEAMRVLAAGGLDTGQIDQLAAIDPGSMTAVLLSLLLASSLAALFLGCWWYSLISDGLSFGEEFRALRLGRVAAGSLTALVAIGLFSPIPSVSAVAPLALVGFLFQGLAVLHARRHSEGWHRAIMVLVYLSLLSPLAAWMYLGVSAIGLLDNFFPLRARAGSRD
jgi:hypothetical protein